MFQPKGLAQLKVGEVFKTLVGDSVFLAFFGGDIDDLRRYVRLTAHAGLIPEGGTFRFQVDHDASLLGFDITIERLT